MMAPILEFVYKGVDEFVIDDDFVCPARDFKKEAADMLADLQEAAKEKARLEEEEAARIAAEELERLRLIAEKEAADAKAAREAAEAKAKAEAEAKAKDEAEVEQALVGLEDEGDSSRNPASCEVHKAKTPFIDLALKIISRYESKHGSNGRMEQRKQWLYGLKKKMEDRYSSCNAQKSCRWWDFRCHFKRWRGGH
jgi:hypothetical protein